MPFFIIAILFSASIWSSFIKVLNCCYIPICKPLIDYSFFKNSFLTATMFSLKKYHPCHWAWHCFRVYRIAVFIGGCVPWCRDFFWFLTGPWFFPHVHSLIGLVVRSYDFLVCSGNLFACLKSLCWCLIQFVSFGM